MDGQIQDSISLWLDRLKAGESVAAQRIWDEYFVRLISVAHARLSGMARESDGEDIALSALKSVMIGMKANRFPDVADHSDLWPLLVTITARKSQNVLRRHTTAKRSVMAEQEGAVLAELKAEDPNPEFAVEIADELERLVLLFDDPTLRVIAQRKLEGYLNEEIAQELGVSPRTIIRKLKRIRQEWEAHEA